VGCCLLLVAACAPATASRPAAPVASDVPKPTVRKHLTAAVMGNLHTMSSLLAMGGTGTSTPGTGEVGSLVNFGLTGAGLTTSREALLAEAVPAPENGLWTVLPDGRMETTWRIRPGAAWHDGTPVTADDLLFTDRVASDRELGTARDRRLDLVEELRATDSRTLVATWKQPYIQADALFETGAYAPLPAHLLSDAYTTDKGNLLNLPYWNRAFVGTGPFRLRDFVEGSHLMLDANDRFVLGRPKIDEIEVRFIPAAQTVIANVVSGAVEMVLGRGLSLQEAVTIRDQWRNGTVYAVTDSPRSLVPQHTDPTPPIIGNVQFRKALAYAIDREEMAATLGLGLGPVADVGIPLSDPMYQAVAPALVRYPYDGRRAVGMIEEQGYTRGTDGGFRDGAGQPLEVGLRSSERQVNVNVILSAAEYWNRLGVTARTEVVPLAESTADPGKYAAFPGFQTGGGNFAGLPTLDNLRPERVPGPQNGFLGPNTGRYVNAELVALIDRYFVTIPLPERIEVLQAVFRHITDRVVVIPLYYDTTPSVIGSRVANAAPAYFGNSYLWELN
jgi:peptide/nickel transport system substrate-binding protein